MLQGEWRLEKKAQTRRQLGKKQSGKWVNRGEKRATVTKKSVNLKGILQVERISTEKGTFHCTHDRRISRRRQKIYSLYWRRKILDKNSSDCGTSGNISSTRGRQKPRKHMRKWFFWQAASRRGFFRQRYHLCRRFSNKKMTASIKQELNAVGEITALWLSSKQLKI